MKPVKKATLLAPDGTLFHCSIDNGALWIHLEAPPGKSAVIGEFEPNAGNEGWLRHQQRDAVQSQALVERR